MISPENNLFLNFVLIGMAGAGKSTVGPLLAKRLDYDYVDTDDLIAASHATRLQQVLDTLGSEQFQAEEEKTLVSINLRNHVIATGGSAIYSRPGMEHLRQIGLVVWLDVDLELLKRRVNNIDSRGLVNPDSMSFAELYRQRLVFYKKYAHVRIQCAEDTPEDIAEKIILKVEREKGLDSGLSAFSQ